MVAATSREDFPLGIESRMADFMELAGMAIANAQAEQELRELAETQESLRRLAMLVARGELPEAVFAAVTKEVLRHFGSGTARMIRFELDGTATLVANEGTTGPHVRVGQPWEGYPSTGLTATVRRTGQAARVDDYLDVPGGEQYLGEGLRSAVAMPVHVHGRLWGLIAVGSGQGPLPPDTEQRMTEFTDLVGTAVANAQSRAELMASRARIVAASDEARRRIERDLHDGAQQHLVALAYKLRSAEASHESGEIRAEIAGVAAELMSVLDDLREISRGIHPAILSKAGLRPALRALGRRSTIPVDVQVRVDGRLPEPVEVGAYYVVSEMLANAAKHARASVVEVDAEASGGTLRLRVRDDGIGGADPVRGSGLLGLKDRIEALGGTLSVHSPVGRGTTVSCELPVLVGGGFPNADPVKKQS
jgi:signal transduction histidine kinase